jgi:hypothetical protein
MNLVVNGNFQTGDFTGWTRSVPPDPVISTSGRPVGTPPYYCAEFQSGNGGDLYQTISISPSTLYYVTVWIERFGPSPSGSVALDVIGFASSTIYISSFMNPSTINTWQSFHFTFTTIPTETNVLFLLSLVNGITNQYRIDDVWMSTSPICYAGPTKIRVKRITDGFIEEVQVDKITPAKYEVINIHGESIPISKNIVSGPVKRLREIPANAFGDGIPSDTLLLTSGHKLLVDDVEIKARHLSLAKKKTVEPTLVYSLVCPTRQYIYANNQPVVAFGLNEWENVEDLVNHTEN